MPADTAVRPGHSTVLLEEPVPQEVRDTLCGFSLLLGGANVIMQLSRLPVGHGVAKSTVDSGRVDKHPLKRLRTTSAFLVISMHGTVEERLKLRSEIARSHASVHSKPDDEVQYNAFDPELQLWVAACLYFGTEDVYTRMYGPLRREQRVRLLNHGKRFGTTLQMPDGMWPETPEAFDEYWADGCSKIQMDDFTRHYLQGIATNRFLFEPLGRYGRRLAKANAPGATFAQLGFLPKPFRDELGLPWNDEAQRKHDAHFGRLARRAARMPHLLRDFPLNAYLWDTRRRLHAGKAVV
ncbi:MAG: DUF2236 domain-containing protein [Solirubrobacteraceae bacterium]|nr:DUF2236 domain-containing protein [Solirubrobacteraceae bacterium]